MNDARSINPWTDQFSGGRVVALTEARSADRDDITIWVRTASDQLLRVTFGGVGTRVIENVGGTVIASLKELPAPAPYRQYVFNAEPDAFRREIKIVARTIEITRLEETPMLPE